MEINEARFGSNQQIVSLNKIEEPSRGLPELITFDDVCDELDQNLSDGEKKSEGQFEPSLSAQGQSVVRKTEIRKKFTQYLGNRRTFKNIHRSQNLPDFEDGQNVDPKGKLIRQFKQIHSQQNTYRQRQHFIIAFNKKPELAINQYIQKGVLRDDPKSIANHLIRTQGLNKIILGEYFGENKERNMKVLRQFCNMLDFKDIQFDLALRRLLAKFRLPGQAQQIQRIVWQFAQAYFQVNKDQYDNAEELHVFSYAIIMLATNAHSPNVQKKMTKQQFINQTKYGCPSIGHDKFSQVYDRITTRKLQTDISITETLYSRLKDISLGDIPGALNIAKDLKNGDIFLKSCKNSNKMVQRKVYLSRDQRQILWVVDPPKGQEEQPRSINIKDIIDINLGLESQVMQKNKTPQQFDSMCFTITTQLRTLDLKAQSNKIRAKWINYLRAILLQKRQERISKVEHEHDLNWSPDKIQDIWNNQIFPFWDKHWDYKNRRPKSKGYFARGMEMVCSCWKGPQNNFEEKYSSYNLKLKSTLLDTLWRYGLPAASRKTLWPLVIGNNLALTNHMLEQIKKRKRDIPDLKKLSRNKQIVEMGQILMAVRPDLPPIKELLSICQVFYKTIPPSSGTSPLFGLINLIHSHHFLNFYRKDRNETELRIFLFQKLLMRNSKSVYNHFLGLKLEPKMYLLKWFLEVFAGCFKDEFLYRIWDNFLLEGQLYLFKVGITLIKYYEIELKMCTYDEGIKLLRSPPHPSAVLFFDILENQIDVKDYDYQEGVERRKHAVVKAKVQQIPLE